MPLLSHFYTNKTVVNHGLIGQIVTQKSEVIVVDKSLHWH